MSSDKLLEHGRLLKVPMASVGGPVGVASAVGSVGLVALDS